MTRDCMTEAGCPFPFLKQRVAVSCKPGDSEPEESVFLVKDV